MRAAALHPGQNDTERLLAPYGDRLVCVRHRYDVRRKKRFRTVEIIAAEREWRPRTVPSGPEQIVEVRVALPEITMRERVKQASGRCDPTRKVWRLNSERVTALGLADRVVGLPASTSRCRGGRGG